MGIVCSTDDTDNGTLASPNPYRIPADEKKAMEERNEAARIKRLEDRALKEAMRQSARAMSEENVANEDVFVSSSDV
jgi:hypothetical protein